MIDVKKDIRRKSMFDDKNLEELNPSEEEIKMMQDDSEICEEAEEDSYTGDSMQWYLREI